MARQQPSCEFSVIGYRLSASGYRRPIPSVIASQPFLPRNLGNSLHSSRGFQDSLKVSEILDFNGQRPGDVTVRALQLEAPDIGISSRHRLGEIRVKTATVGSIENEPHHEPLALELLPVDIESSLRLEHQHQEIRTIRPMD